MKRIKLAWRVLTGRTHVLEVSQENLDAVMKSVKADRSTVENVIDTAMYLYEENTEPYREMMDRETQVANQVREAMKGIEL